MATKTLLGQASLSATSPGDDSLVARPRLFSPVVKTHQGFMTTKNSCTHPALVISTKESGTATKKANQSHNDTNLSILNVNPTLNGLTLKMKDERLAEYVDEFSFQQKFKRNRRIGSPASPLGSEDAADIFKQVAETYSPSSGTDVYGTKGALNSSTARRKSVLKKIFRNDSTTPPTAA